MLNDRTAVQQLLLDATGAALQGKSVAWVEVSPEQWKSLMALAAAHKLLPLVVEAAYRSTAAAGWADFAMWKRQAIQQVKSQALRTGAFLELFDALRQAGLHPLVVKGILCRSLYPKGDHRPSGDEDLLVSGSEFLPCCRALQDLGMVPDKPYSADTAEVGWRKPESPLYLELHQNLFSPDAGAYGSLEVCFAGALDRAVEYPVTGGKTVLSLDPQDHMLYLLLHAYKHFIHSGFGIRQICDIGLWAVRYRERIDWERLSSQCAGVRARTFAASVFQIGRKHLGIPLELPEIWQRIPVDCEPMLLDLLQAGVYGSADRSRLHSATVTLSAVEAQRKNVRPSGLIPTLFPPKKSLEGSYPVLKKHPYLLPGVWCARIAKYGKETLTSRQDNSAAKSLRIARERIGLLKKYDIIE